MLASKSVMPRFLMPWTNWSRIARSAAALLFASAAPGESTGAFGLSSSRSSRASSRDIFPSFPKSSTRDAALFCEAVGDFFETGDGKPLVRFGGDRVGIGDRAVAPSSDVLGMNAETNLKSLAEKPPACSPSRYLTCFKSAGVLGRLLLLRGAATGASAMLPTLCLARGGGAAAGRRRRLGRRVRAASLCSLPSAAIQLVGEGAVSYTHLTLPTIYSV